MADEDKIIDKNKDETNDEVKSVSTKKTNRFKNIKQSKYFLPILVVLIALIPSYYFYHRSQQAEQRLNDPNTANQKVVDEVVKKVGNHIILPSDEQPTLATVSDVNKVKGQPFFNNAKNGDKILVYTQARKAILYRPSKDIVVEVAPLNIDASQLKATSQ